MMKKKSRIILLFLGVLIGVGFSVSPLWAAEDYNLDELDLENIPARVSIDNVSVSLRCYFDRSFFLSTDPDTSLRCILYLSSNISSDLFSELIVTEFWALTGNATWHLKSGSIYPEIYESDIVITNILLRITLRDGPDNDQWTSNDLIDVVVKMEYKSDEYYVQSRDNLINFSI